MDKMKVAKGLLSWTVVNGLFAWAVFGACILGIGIAYNFMAWITGAMCVFAILGYAGTQVMKREAPEKYQEIADVYNNGFHVHRVIDIAYDACIIAMMLYGGFLGIASVYLVLMVAQHAYIGGLKNSAESYQTSETIVGEYDDNLLDRMGVNQNERGR